MGSGDKETEPRESGKVQAGVRTEARSVKRGARGAARGDSRWGESRREGRGAKKGRAWSRNTSAVRDTVRLGRLRRRAPWALRQPAHGLRRTRVCRPRPAGALRRGEEDYE